MIALALLLALLLLADALQAERVPSRLAQLARREAAWFWLSVKKARPPKGYGS